MKRLLTEKNMIGFVFYIGFIALLCVGGSWNQAQASDRGIVVNAQSANGQSKEIDLYSGYHALVIGAGAYENGWPQLQNAVSDAREVASTLKDMGWSVNFVENPDWDRLDTALTRLIAGPGKKRNHAILIWYSGHGHTLQEADGAKLGYLVPVDAPLPSRNEVGFMRKAVDMRQMETLARRIVSRHVLMVFDSCFSGSVFNINRAAPSRYIQEKVAEPVREILTAGSEHEKVPDRSIFKTVFLQAVGKGYGDMNKDGYVTGEELGAYVQEKVINYSRQAQHPQFGKINNPKLDKGDFVFVPQELSELEQVKRELAQLKKQHAALQSKHTEAQEVLAAVRSRMHTRDKTKRSLTLRTKPSGAKVFVDDTLQGEAPVTLELPSSKKHLIKAIHEKFKSTEFTLQVREGGPQEIGLHLVPLPESRSADHSSQRELIHQPSEREFEKDWRAASPSSDSETDVKKEWKAKYHKPTKKGTWHVIVASISTSAEKFLESKLQDLEDRYQEVAFDYFLSANQQGGNKLYAIVLGRGLDLQTAKKLAHYARKNGIAKDAYISQQHF